jgi:hypothetical protein
MPTGKQPNDVLSDFPCISRLKHDILQQFMKFEEVLSNKLNGDGTKREKAGTQARAKL